MYRPPLGTFRYLGGLDNFDGCEFLRTAKPGNPLMPFYEHLHKVSHGLIHHCPYEPGKYKFENFTTSIEKMSLYMKGDYKLTIFARDEIDPAGLNISVDYSFIVRGGDTF
jgi:Protein of unknown function (DUF1091)